MIKPFLNIEEFTQYTGFNIEKSIVMRPKKIGKDVELIVGIITGFKIQEKQVAIGASWYSLQELFENYEYEKVDKWCVFGTVEPDEVKEKKPAKFKVGKQYTGTNAIDEQYSVFINAKYRDPKDKRVRVIVDNCQLIPVFTDENGNERFKLLDDVIKAEDEEGEIGF